MKVMQINCVFRFGSTGRIVYDLHTGLQNMGHESVVVYGRGQKYNEKNIYKASTEIGAKIHSFCTLLFGVRFGFSPLATRKVINLIKKEKPDVVHLHCLNANFVNVYKLIEFLKKENIKTVLTLHAEIMHTAGCEHSLECEKWKTECFDCPKIRGKISRYFRDDAKYCFNRMKKAIQGFGNLTVVGVSEWLTERAKKSPIMQGMKFDTVHNGIDTESFHPTEYAGLKEKLGIPEGKKIVLHVTPNFNHPIKGGKYVIEVAKKLPDYQFIIVGFNGDKNILPENIIPISHTKDKKELAAFYSMADCFLCTSLRECLPTVCLEAVSCGAKVVAFKTGGIPETIPEGMGECVECYNIDEMCRAVITECKEKASEIIADESRRNNGKNVFLHKYMYLYEED